MLQYATHYHILPRTTHAQLLHNFVPSRCSAMESKHLDGGSFRSSQTRNIRNKKHMCHVSHCVTCQCSKTVPKTCQETFQTVTDISALSLNLFQPSSEVGAHHMARPSRFQVAGADPVDCGKKDKASGHAEHLKPGFTLSP
jgi:hypothetical protein